MDRHSRMLGTAFLLAALALGFHIGCRSAAPASGAKASQPAQTAANGTNAKPLPSPQTVPGPSPTPNPDAVTASAPKPDSAAVGSEAAQLAEPGEEETVTGPQAQQKEALDLCQSASDLLDRGEREQALVALDRAYELMIALPSNGEDAGLQAKDDIRLLVANLVVRAHRPAVPAKPPSRSWDLALPIVNNAHVEREIRSFTTVERAVFQDAYQRSGAYRPMILAKLEAAGLPSQLSWLPLVESNFKVRALSSAGALGLWQFIASTGQRYGLSRDGWIDERLDPEKATDAALAYLTTLHGLFGDWPKALAGYNCGEVYVLRSQRRAADQYQDFWDLYEQLPFETRRYVPRFIAALLIIEDPAKYGMTLPEPWAPPNGLSRVRVERAVDLDKLDEAIGLAKGTLRELNPELRSGATPPRPYDLRGPADKQDAIPVAAGKLPEWKRPLPLYLTHRVRSGETLGLIARRYGTTVGAIQRANALRSANRLRIGQVLRIPVRDRLAR